MQKQQTTVAQQWTNNFPRIEAETCIVKLAKIAIHVRVAVYSKNMNNLRNLLIYVKLLVLIYIYIFEILYAIPSIRKSANPQIYLSVTYKIYNVK